MTVANTTPLPGLLPVWAITVHFGDPAVTRALMAAIRASEVAAQVVVVDNDRNWEGDGVGTLIRADHNLGFAAGVNLGIRCAMEAGANAVWILNNDVLPEPTTLGWLLATAGRAAPAAVVGCVQRRPGNVDGLAADVTRTPVAPRSLRGRVRVIGHPGLPVDFLSAFCLLVTRPALDLLGGFDESFFHYFEDVEFSLRAIERGVDVILDTSIVVEHAQGTSMPSASPDAAYYATRNRLLLASRLRHQRPLVSLFRVEPSVGLRPLMSRRRDRAWLTSVWSGTRDGILGRSGPRGA
ncbi:MAG: glycosyltransferase family 2 protein [Candidatus Limnocylindrales bacterium]